MKTREIPGSKAQRLRTKIATLASGDELRIAIEDHGPIFFALFDLGKRGSVSRTNETHQMNDGTILPVWLLEIQ